MIAGSALGGVCIGKLRAGRLMLDGRLPCVSAWAMERAFGASACCRHMARWGFWVLYFSINALGTFYYYLYQNVCFLSGVPSVVLK
jgi:hypothetical protein